MKATNIIRTSGIGYINFIIDLLFYSRFNLGYSCIRKNILTNRRQRRISCNGIKEYKYYVSANFCNVVENEIERIKVYDGWRGVKAKRR